MICPKCNNESPPDVRKCLVCGFDFESATLEQGVTKKLTSGGGSTLRPIQICPGCGTSLQSGQKFCTKCGTNLSKDDDDDEANNANTLKPDNSDLINQGQPPPSTNYPDGSTYLQKSIKTGEIGPQVIGGLSYRYSVVNNNRQYYCPECFKKILEHNPEKDELLELTIIESQYISNCLMCKRPLNHTGHVTQAHGALESVKAIPQQAMNAVKNAWNNRATPNSGSSGKTCGTICCCLIILYFIVEFLFFY